MDRTLISWNVPNVVTIWLMLALGFLLVTLVGNYATGWLGSKQTDGNASGTGGW